MSDRDPLYAPAIRVRGQVHAAPRPAEDDDVNDMMHGDAIMDAWKRGKMSRAEANSALLHPDNMGFVTRSGKYLTRREAAAHVLTHNQFRIGNEKDPQLIKLKARLRHQLDTGHPETSLDSYDINFFAKGMPTFREHLNLKNDEFHAVELEVTHPDGKQGMAIHMMRSHDDPEGQWSVHNIDPVDHTLSIDGHTHSRAFANRLGPAVIRHTVRHLKEKYGVKKIDGFRVSGVRFAGQPDDHDAIEERDSQRINVDLGKSTAGQEPPHYFHTELDKVYGEGKTAMHEKRFRIVDNRRGHRAEVELTRHAADQDGSWHISIGPVPEDGGGLHRKHANKIGPSTIRALARFLRTEHGVKQVYGQRVTGARNPGHGPTGNDDGPMVYRQLTKALEALRGKGRGDALQPWHLRKKRGPLKFNEDPIEIVRSTPSPMRDRFNAPVEKSWVDAGDKPQGQSAWKVVPFRPLMGGKGQRGVEHARISAPGNRGAIMSFKHNPKTGHTEILNFRAYTFHDQAFKAGEQAMREGKSSRDVDNIIEFHRSNVGVIGASGVRAAARYLKENYGSKTVGGTRVSGTRMNNQNDMKRAPVRQSGGLESLPGVKVKRDISKAIDYDALEEEHEPRPKKAGGKSKPVGSRTDQARHQTPAFNATKNRVEQLKKEGKL